MGSQGLMSSIGEKAFRACFACAVRAFVTEYPRGMQVCRGLNVCYEESFVLSGDFHTDFLRLRSALTIRCAAFLATNPR